MNLDERIRGLGLELRAAAKAALEGADLDLAARLVNAHGSLRVLGEHARDDRRTRDAIVEAEAALRRWRGSRD